MRRKKVAAWLIHEGMDEICKVNVNHLKSANQDAGYLRRMGKKIHRLFA